MERRAKSGERNRNAHYYAISDSDRQAGRTKNADHETARPIKTTKRLRGEGAGHGAGSKGQSRSQKAEVRGQKKRENSQHSTSNAQGKRSEVRSQRSDDPDETGFHGTGIQWRGNRSRGHSPTSRSTSSYNCCPSQVPRARKRSSPSLKSDTTALTSRSPPHVATRPARGERSIPDGQRDER